MVPSTKCCNVERTQAHTHDDQQQQLRGTYQTTPVSANAMPKNFFMDMESPKSMTPMVKMPTVFKCPTILYVRGDVAPIIKKVESDTNIPRQPLSAMVITASVEHDSLYHCEYESNPNSLFSGSCMSIGVQHASMTTTNGVYLEQSSGVATSFATHVHVSIAAEYRADAGRTGWLADLEMQRRTWTQT